jgi:uncharacterized protein with NRDE domain
MCIVVFRWQPDSSEPLTLAANRDEFFARPTAAMHWWQDGSTLAGRDLQSGGTWLGVTRSGRFALLTNVRNPALRKTNAPSRGNIVSDFLLSEQSAETFIRELATRADAYEGFNALCGTLSSHANEAPSALWFLNSIENAPRHLANGQYTLSNATLDTAWPKTARLKISFATALSETDFPTRIQSLRTMMLDDRRANDASLPATGVPIEWERALSSIFIRDTFATRDDARATREYGTRSTTVLHVARDDLIAHVSIAETTHTERTVSDSTATFEFELSNN